jgi:hypothetical protein
MIVRAGRHALGVDHAIGQQDSMIVPGDTP